MWGGDEREMVNKLLMSGIGAKTKSKKATRLIQLVHAYFPYYLLLLPALLFFLIFRYIPMYGLTIAFKDFVPFLGYWDSPWVGLENFKRLIGYRDFYLVFRNTLLISLYKLAFAFPVPVFLAILLNEIHTSWFKRSVQTVLYLPHFVSWVIMGSIVTMALSPSTGIVNNIIRAFGGEPIFFMISTFWFRPIVVLSSIWKESGWGTIVYLAAIAGIDQQLYEAAIVDGASRFRRMWHITLPCIRSVVIILLIIRIGHILDVGFHQILVLYNPAVYDVADVFGTYVYRVGLSGGQFSFATAIGLFKSVFGLILVIGANKLAKAFGESGIW